MNPGILLGRLQDRLLLMPGAFAEHAVEAKADEQCDEREDDDDGQASKIPFGLTLQHSAHQVKIPTAPTHEGGIAPHKCGC
jgi:hypothetical protein